MSVFMGVVGVLTTLVGLGSMFVGPNEGVGVVGGAALFVGGMAVILLVSIDGRLSALCDITSKRNKKDTKEQAKQ